MTVIFETIQTHLKTYPIVLYMKGTKRAPLCGFSGGVAQILTRLGAEFHDVNVLEDPEIRQGIKDFTNWPTIPQLYIQGEFIGGADIIREMYESGELKTLLEEKGLVTVNN
ncbi:glutaredoxin [Candidatus Paracaedimonas acanthamoebae]|nr:glutaredoxin [Candidatus Paracaedimonas acanthamoebae]